MNIIVTGASGFVGSALVPYLTRAGHRVIELKRGRAASGAWWDPERGEIDLAASGPVDVIIHLAGENIAQPWTAAAKERMSKSRIAGTTLVARAAAALQPRPRAFLSASAIGYYGDRGEELLTEESRQGRGFLANLCSEWEAASLSAAQTGIRVLHLRFGIVLDPSGGALKRMVAPFRRGLGGRLGSGRQYWSWVTRDDAIRAVDHLLNDQSAHGPFNIVSPNPVRNSEFTKTLARTLRRPAWFPIPAFALRMFAGEMADAALLASQRVLPQRLKRSGYRFEDGDFEAALRKILRPR